jgi:hypothetical protein
MAWESLAAAAFQLRAARGTLNCTTQQRWRLPFLNSISCFVHFLVTVFSALETASQGNARYR